MSCILFITKYQYVLVQDNLNANCGSNLLINYIYCASNLLSHSPSEVLSLSKITSIVIDTDIGMVTHNLCTTKKRELNVLKNVTCHLFATFLANWYRGIGKLSHRTQTLKPLYNKKREHNVLKNFEMIKYQSKKKMHKSKIKFSTKYAFVSAIRVKSVLFTNCQNINNGK